MGQWLSADLSVMDVHLQVWMVLVTAILLVWFAFVSATRQVRRGGTLLKLHIFTGLPDPSGTLRLQARVSVLCPWGIMKKIIRKGDRARRQRVSKPQRFNSK